MRVPTSTISIAVAVAVVVSGTCAMAESYTGKWPVKVTHAPRGDGAYCLTLTDNGGDRWPHSGPAALTGPGQNLPYGTFQLIGHLLVATILQPGGRQNAGLVFIATAQNGVVGKGVFEQVYAGEESDSGALSFGMKGGC